MAVVLSDLALVGSKPGQRFIENRISPMYRVPPTSTTMLVDPKEKQAVIFWHQCRGRTDARAGLNTIHGTDIGSPTSDFTSEFTPDAFDFP